jgi:hypothetical protein
VRAQQPLGPEAPAYPADLEQLRGELKQQVEAAGRRTDADEAAIMRLHLMLDEERRARVAAETALRDESKSVADAPLVHAGRFGLKLSGFLQVDATAWSQAAQDQLNPSTNAPLNDVRFNVRRARIRAEIDWRMLAGAIEFDGNTVNGYQARIIGAEASLVWRNPAAPSLPYFQLTAGSFKIPFGFEVGQRDIDRLFLERSTMERAFFPGEYDLGARGGGGWHFLRYTLAVMNGDPIGEKAFPGRDPNQSKDVIGRVGVDLLMRRLGLAGDVSALWGTGFHSGTPSTKDQLVWRDTNQDGAVQVNEIVVIAGQSPTPSQNFTRWAVGGDLRLTLALPVVGQLMIYGELTYATNLDRNLFVADPVAAARDLRELGFYFAVTQELTSWAAVGVRYDRYDPDRDANDLRGGVQVPRDSSYSTLAVAAAARYAGYGRLILEYDHNTNALGRTLTGTPATLANDTFMLRAEARF